MVNLDELSSIVEQLDKCVSKENAKVRLYQYGGEDEDGCIRATKNGYLRFGVELLKAGIAPTSSDITNVVEVDLEYLIDEGSSITFSSFERTEDIDREQYVETWRDSLFIYVIIGVLIATPILAVIGLISLIRMLF